MHSARTRRTHANARGVLLEAALSFFLGRGKIKLHQRAESQRSCVLVCVVCLLVFFLVSFWVLVFCFLYCTVTANGLCIDPIQFSFVSHRHFDQCCCCINSVNLHKCNCLSGLINHLARAIWRWTEKQGGPENPKARRHTARLFLKILGCGQLCSARNRRKIFT